MSDMKKRSHPRPLSKRVSD